MKKKVAKILSCLMAIVMLLSFAPLDPLAEFGVIASAIGLGDSGQCGDNVTYRLDSDGVLTISGTGDMTDYDWRSPFYQNSSIKSIIIENGVTSISNSAFRDCTRLTSVTIPNSVTSIGGSAFYCCTGLTSVTIPNSVTGIGSDAFSGCTGITSVTIGNGVKWIAYDAFRYCVNLSNVTLGNNVENIYSEAFFGCTSLKEITIPSSVRSIDDYAFGYVYGEGEYTKLDDLTIKGYTNSAAHKYAVKNGFNFVSMGTVSPWFYESFYDGIVITEYTGVESNVTIPDTIDGKAVVKIGTSVFEGNEQLTSVTIPDSVEGIGWYAFRYCDNLTTVTLGNGVKYIEGCAFEDCRSLVNITIGDGVTSIGSGAFSGCDKLKSVKFGNKVRYISDGAFYGCISLKEVTLRCNVITIGEEALGYCTDKETGKTKKIDGFKIKGYANSSIQRYAIKNGIDFETPKVENPFVFESVDGGVKITEYIGFDTNIIVPSDFDGKQVVSIGDNAFSGNSGIESVTIPNSVKVIGNSAFSWCNKLTTVTLENGLLSIGDEAFYCSSYDFNNVTIPASVTKIGDYAFGYFDDGDPYIDIDNFTIHGYKGSEAERYANDNGFSFNSIGGEDPLWDYKRYDDGIRITGYKGSESEVEIPREVRGITVTEIGDSAFSDCYELTSITIPNSVTEIGDSAFSACCNLKSIVIPDSVKSINYGVFSYCSSLTNVTIPNSVITIGDYAFSYCNNLESITIPTSVTTIGYDAFSNCERLNSVMIPDGVISIGDGAFAVCSSLTSITVCEDNEYYSSQDGVLFNKNKTELIKYPEGNERAKYIIPDNVTSIEHAAFANNNSLVNVIIPNSVTSIGDYAFSCCGSLTSVTIPNGVMSIGYNAFFNCKNVSNITIPESVTSIGEEAFYCCSSLSEVTIPKSVNYIGEYAFGYYKNDDSYEPIKLSGFTIIGNIDSEAERYAKDNELKFVCLDHEHSYTSSITKQPTCTESGMKTFTCSCGDSYTETIPATGHVDANKDGYCDTCSTELEHHTDNCDCICHKTGLVGFIYKIILVFWKLFRINRTCVCGGVHY